VAQLVEALRYKMAGMIGHWPEVDRARNRNVFGLEEIFTSFVELSFVLCWC
jgi:hypothetical protein